MSYLKFPRIFKSL